MASWKDDFLHGDDLDAVFALLDEDDDYINDNLISEISSQVENSCQDAPKDDLKCSICNKSYKTQRGLKRHHVSIHEKKDCSLSATVFQTFIVSAASKLSSDECYPDAMRSDFSLFNNISVENASVILEKVQDIISKFDGNSDNFFPLFYKRVSNSKGLFKDISHNSQLTLGFELANYILAHLRKNDQDQETPPMEKKLSPKEKSIVAYISGYVYGEFYRRLRYSKTPKNCFYEQHLKFLISGKMLPVDHDDDNSSSTTVYHLVNAKDRGGLWRVSVDIINLFIFVETTFQVKSRSFSTNIDSTSIVKDLLSHPDVVDLFAVIYSRCSEEVEEEVAKNLLEDLIMLYIRVRTFSFVKDKNELHQRLSKSKRARSLRTALKRSSSAMSSLSINE